MNINFLKVSLNCEALQEPFNESEDICVSFRSKDFFVQFVERYANNVGLLSFLYEFIQCFYSDFIGAELLRVDSITERR